MASSDEEEEPDMSLEDITDGRNERGIPAALFIEDIGKFSADKGGASAELLIGAYTELLGKYQESERQLQSKSTCPSKHCRDGVGGGAWNARTL